MVGEATVGTILCYLLRRTANGSSCRFGLTTTLATGAGVQRPRDDDVARGEIEACRDVRGQARGSFGILDECEDGRSPRALADSLDPRLSKVRDQGLDAIRSEDSALDLGEDLADSDL